MKRTLMTGRGTILTATAIFLLLLIPFGAAPGIAPGWISVTPGTPHQSTITVYNTEDIPTRFRVAIEGELARYLSITPVRLNLSGQQSALTLRGEVPATLSPGPHFGKVVLTQLPEPTQDVQLQAGVILASTIEAFIPYPGDHAEGKLYIESSNPKESRAALTLFNRGTTPLTLETQVTITRLDGTPMTTASAPALFLSKGALGPIEAPFSVPPGPYLASAKVSYADKTLSLSAPFAAGKPAFILKGFKAPDFRLGQINKVMMDIESVWNAPLEDVTAHLTITKEATQIADMETNKLSLPPNGEGTLETHFDTKNLNEGIYDANLTIIAGEATHSITFEIYMTEDSLRIFGEEKESTPSIMPLLIVILFAVLMGSVIVIARRHKR